MADAGPPRFVSTRDERPEPKLYTLDDAVLLGWAPPDEAGGLPGMFVPTAIPTLSKAELQRWRGLSYKEVCFELLSLFRDDESSVITSDELRSLVLDSECKLVPVVSLDSPSSARKIHVAELWHGPTLAFKDLSISIFMKYLDCLCRKQNRKTNLLVATSGDTGSAAIDGVLTTACTHISATVLLPSRAISSVTLEQEWQMVRHAEHPNINVLCCEGTSDDLDVVIERVFADEEFKRRHSLSTVNSVNVLRLIVQAAHYVHVYLSLGLGAEGASFFVPSGGMGHLCSGVIARKLLSGLGTVRLVGCVNENKAFHTLMSEGELRSKGMKLKKTLAPSMDIVVPYNLERMLFFSNDKPKLKLKLKRWKVEGTLELSQHEKSAFGEELGLAAGTTDDAAIKATIRAWSVGFGYTIDPHTAVAAAVAAEVQGSGPAVIVMACAHPLKFRGTVEAALGKPASEWVLEKDKKDQAVRDLLSLDPNSADTLSGTPGLVHFRKSGQEWADDWTQKLRSLLSSTCL